LLFLSTPFFTYLFLLFRSFFFFFFVDKRDINPKKTKKEGERERGVAVIEPVE